VDLPFVASNRTPGSVGDPSLLGTGLGVHPFLFHPRLESEGYAFPLGRPYTGLNPWTLPMPPKLRSLPSLVRTVDTSTTPLPPKVKDHVYTTPQFRAWRTMVVARAGGRCEAVDHGMRCTKARPEHRMYSDHIVELHDGGSLFDINNGQCLCASHHTMKTMAARYRRHSNVDYGG
jgi:5-methylcytosine-specific restriction enzyme A